MSTNQLLGNELFDRLQSIQDAELQAALDTTRKLRKGENVSDGELLDTLFAFSVRLDIASPLLPACHEAIKRLMVYGGITETPRGTKREWMENLHDEQ